MRRYCITAAIALVLLGSLYMYFVSTTVVHVVVRKELDQDIAALHSDIATLEAEYIAAQHAVSAHIASLPGFIENPDKIFIDRGADALVVRTP